MRLIDIDDNRNCYIGSDGEYEKYNIDPDVLMEGVYEYSNKKINLKPCPFCGKKPETKVVLHGTYDYRIQLDARISCKKCGIGVGKVFDATGIEFDLFERNYVKAFDRAAKKWNQRE